MSRDFKMAIEIESLSVRYGAVQAVNNVSFSHGEGKTLGVIGLNGAGKTTLIKTLLKLRRPDRGEVKIFGEALRLKTVKNNIAYLPERFNPPWFLTGYEFLKFTHDLYGVAFSKNKAEKEAENLALDPTALSRRITTYSKGMRQKIGLIASMETPCRCIVLDEPMSGLDPQARKLMKDAIRKAQDTGKTILISSHVLADINEICDTVIVLHQGQIVFQGTPSKLVEKGGDQNIEKAFLNLISGCKAA